MRFTRLINSDCQNRRVNRKSKIENSKSFSLRGPTLFHQGQQMLERFLVTAVFFGGELAGAFVELRGHLGGFFRRTAEGDEDLGKLENFHRLKRRGGAAAPPKFIQSRPRSSAALPQFISPSRAERG